MLASHNIMDYSLLLGIENKVKIFGGEQDEILNEKNHVQTPRRTIGNRFDSATLSRHRFYSD